MASYSWNMQGLHTHTKASVRVCSSGSRSDYKQPLTLYGSLIVGGVLAILHPWRCAPRRVASTPPPHGTGFNLYGLPCPLINWLQSSSYLVVSWLHSSLCHSYHNCRFLNLLQRSLYVQCPPLTLLLPRAVSIVCVRPLYEVAGYPLFRSIEVRGKDSRDFQNCLLYLGCPRVPLSGVPL